MKLNRIEKSVAAEENNPDMELCLEIAKAYDSCRNKPEVASFKRLIGESRKLGFPIICDIQDDNLDKKVRWAAMLCLSVAEAWPIDNVPEILHISDSSLLADAFFVLNNASTKYQRKPKERCE